jgi:hypothetical protein
MVAAARYRPTSLSKSVADLLLDDLWDELQRGQIYECSLRSKTWQMDGLQEGQNIYIDPRPAILETLLHELLHRRKPRWGERRVAREARRLSVAMDESTKQHWWRGYRRIKKPSKPVEVVD